MRIKQLTGGDRIAARFMRQDFFEFSPQFKLTIIGNHVPELHNVDDAARRRFNMAPFTHKPPVVDKELEEKLRAEWPGYPAVDDRRLPGLAEERPRPPRRRDHEHRRLFQRSGLAGAVDRRMLRDHRRSGPPVVDTVASLLASWRNYAKSRGEEPGSSKGFSMALRSRGFTRIKDESGMRGRGFRGIKVRVHFAPPPEES